MEAEILADMVTYLGDEVSEADNPVLLILIQRAIRRVCAKRYPFGYTGTEKERLSGIGTRYLPPLFTIGRNKGLMVKVLTVRMESAVPMKKRTISILMLYPWQKSYKPFKEDFDYDLRLQEQKNSF